MSSSVGTSDECGGKLMKHITIYLFILTVINGASNALTVFTNDRPRRCRLGHEPTNPFRSDGFQGVAGMKEPF
jgi:hypothetical protein